MNKKQAGVILTLLALIICTGILANRVNDPLKKVGNSNVSSVENLDDSIADGNTDYFTHARAVKDQKDTRAIQTLQGIIQDANTSQENKDKATEEYTKLTTNQRYENDIELSLKGKGFQDVICLIENDQARVYVKSQEKLPQKQASQIQEVITSISQIIDVVIETKE